MKGRLAMMKRTMRTILLWMLLLTTLVFAVACGEKEDKNSEETQPVDIGALARGYKRGRNDRGIIPFTATDVEQCAAIGKVKQHKLCDLPSERKISTRVKKTAASFKHFAVVAMRAAGIREQQIVIPVTCAVKRVTL